MTDLRTSLHRLADSTEPLPVDDDLWGRAQAARRRGQALAVAAVLVLVVTAGGLAFVWPAADREARTASQEVPDGAIPSRIVDPGRLTPVAPTTVRHASVAFVSAARQPVVVGAEDGEYHALDLAGWDGGLLSLSPDGTRLAWTIDADPEGRPREGFALMDMSTGETPSLFSSGTAGEITPQGISWSPSSRWITWFAGGSVSRTDLEPTGVPQEETTKLTPQVEWSAIDDSGVTTLYAGGPRQWDARGLRRLRVPNDAFAAERQGRNDSAIASPSGDAIALATTTAAPGADFLVGGRFTERGLAPDLYPDDAASVTPLGWAAGSLLVAAVDGSPGSYVEGSHLVLMTSPDRPRDEWTYRILLRDVPDVTRLSVAVDLVPELDGTSSQELTHDFGDAAYAQRDVSWIIGLGVAAAIAVLMALRWLWRRLRTPM